ncbi:MAG: hypothetical protein AABY83_00210 [Pseudomonadota bacterium]
MSKLRQLTYSKALNGYLIATLLFALGLRVCWHDVGAVDTHFHVESSLSAVGDNPDTPGVDEDIPMQGLLKLFVSLVFWVAGGAVLALLPASFSILTQRIARDVGRIPLYATHIRPPLRAPPR